MRGGIGWVIAVALALVAFGPGTARAWEQRRNTVSFGFQGGATAMEASGDYTRSGFAEASSVYRYEDFRWGPAFSVHLRYSLDRTHAIGVSFEDLRFRRKSGLGEETANEYQVNNFLVDYYVYFRRRARATPYLAVGAGFHRDAFRFSKSDNLIPPISLAANLVAGMEYFVRPPFSIDATVRGYYLHLRDAGEWKMDGSGPIAGSIQLGFHYYLLK